MGSLKEWWGRLIATGTSTQRHDYQRRAIPCGDRRPNERKKGKCYAVTRGNQAAADRAKRAHVRWPLPLLMWAGQRYEFKAGDPRIHSNGLMHAQWDASQRLHDECAPSIDVLKLTTRHERVPRRVQMKGGTRKVCRRGRRQSDPQISRTVFQRLSYERARCRLRGVQRASRKSFNPIKDY